MIFKSVFFSPPRDRLSLPYLFMAASQSPEPPPYIIASSTRPTEPLNSDEPLTLSIETTRIFSTALPSRTLYSFSQPVLTIGGTGVNVKKHLYRMKDHSLVTEPGNFTALDLGTTDSGDKYTFLPRYLDVLGNSATDTEQAVSAPGAISAVHGRASSQNTLSNSAGSPSSLNDRIKPNSNTDNDGSSFSDAVRSAPGASRQPQSQQRASSVPDLRTQPKPSTTDKRLLELQTSFQIQDIPAQQPRSMLDIPPTPLSSQQSPRLKYYRDEIYDIKSYYIPSAVDRTVIIQGTSKRCYKENLLVRCKGGRKYVLRKEDGCVWTVERDGGGGVFGRLKGKGRGRGDGRVEAGYVWKREDGEALAVESPWEPTESIPGTEDEENTGSKRKGKNRRGVENGEGDVLPLAPVLHVKKKLNDKDTDFLVAVWVARLAWDTKERNKEPWSWEKCKCRTSSL